jgi:hypothetical protein
LMKLRREDGFGEFESLIGGEFKGMNEVRRIATYDSIRPTDLNWVGEVGSGQILKNLRSLGNIG